MQRTRSLPVHTSPQTMLMFQQPGRQQRCFSTYPQTGEVREAVLVSLPTGTQPSVLPLGYL